MTVVGGREVHPINVRVGGFYRAPDAARAAAARRAAGARARDRARDGRAGPPTLDFPDVERDHELVALGRCRALSDRPRAASSPTAASTSRRPSSTSTSSRSTSSTRTRCIARCATAARYLIGPLARYSLASSALPPLAREAAARGRSRADLPQPVPEHHRARRRARAGLRRGARAHRRLRAARRPGGRGRRAPRRRPRRDARRRAECSTTATRSTTTARSSTRDIVPPTSQNQLAIEEDLRAVVERERSTCPTRQLQHPLRAGDPQPRPVHLLRDPLPRAGGRPRLSAGAACRRS